MPKYTVVEDNAGGLHLFVFRGARVKSAYSNFEHNRGALVECLDALDAGDDTHTWDGAIDNPQAAWDQMGDQHGYKTVAEGGGRAKRRLHKAVMGRAAQLEFGVSDDERDAAQAAIYLGSRTSKRKAATSAANGKRGGRPRAIPYNDLHADIQGVLSESKLRRIVALCALRKINAATVVDYINGGAEGWPNWGEHIAQIGRDTAMKIADWIIAGQDA